MRLFSPFDLLIIPIFFAAFYPFFTGAAQNGNNFEIYADGKTIQIPLTKDTAVLINSVEIELKNQTARIVKSGCPNQICVAAGTINSNGQIVCVPNKVIVSIHKKNSGIDVYVH